MEILEYIKEQKALYELVNELEIIAQNSSELWEIESKLRLSDIMANAFILQKDGYILPTTFGLESKEANEALRKALSKYIDTMSLYNLDTKEKRWRAFQDLDVDSVEDNDVEEFFEWIEDLDDYI